MEPAEQVRLECAMARFASGDAAALGEVYDLAAPAVFSFLLRVCRDRHLAEDLTQETFIRIYRFQGLYRPGAAVMPWAYTIARRLFLDAKRARGSEVPAADAAGAAAIGLVEAGLDHGAVATSAEDLLANRELAEAVDDALARIPEPHAVAFRLLKGEGLSVAETAAVMGTSKAAVKVRAHRAYLALRVLLCQRLSPARAPSNLRTKEG